VLHIDFSPSSSFLMRAWTTQRGHDPDNQLKVVATLFIKNN